MNGGWGGEGREAEGRSTWAPPAPPPLETSSGSAPVGPAAWNSLPADIRASLYNCSFRNVLKTHIGLFNLAFNV